LSRAARREVSPVIGQFATGAEPIQAVVAPASFKRDAPLAGQVVSQNSFGIKCYSSTTEAGSRRELVASAVKLWITAPDERACLHHRVRPKIAK
jgi:hypothetical protein